MLYRAGYLERFRDQISSLWVNGGMAFSGSEMWLVGSEPINRGRLGDTPLRFFIESALNSRRSRHHPKELSGCGPGIHHLVLPAGGIVGAVTNDEGA